MSKRNEKAFNQIEGISYPNPKYLKEQEVKEEEQEETIEDNLEFIENSASRLTAFIEGLEAGAILQGLDKDDVYKVRRLYAAASNIGCHCSKIREILEKLNQEKEK